jgi:hypothetical protein
MRAEANLAGEEPQHRAQPAREGLVDVERSCRSKQLYLSKANAKAVARLMGSRHRDQFHLYHCEACGYWHVAHLVPAWLRARPVATLERPSVRFA